MTNGSVSQLKFAATGNRVPDHSAPATSSDASAAMAIKDEHGPSLGARIATVAMGGLALAGGAGAIGAAAKPPETVTVQDSKFFMNPSNSMVNQSGLPMVPSVVPTVLHVVNSGEQAPTSGVFIGSESRSGVSNKNQPTTSLADLNAKFDNVSFQRGGGKPREKGMEKGSEKGREKGYEKGEEKGREKGYEKGQEKGREKGEEKGREKGEEKGREKGTEKGQEKGHEKGQEKGSEKSHEKGSEKPAEHPTRPTPTPTKPTPDPGHPTRPTPTPDPGHPTRPTPTPRPGRPTPAPRPLPPGPAPKPGRPSEPKAPPTHTVKDGGHKYKISEGGWVTQAHRDHPDLKTGTFDHGHDWRNQVVDVRHWHDHDFGHDWYHHDHGFYDGDAFWFGFDMGVWSSWDWNAQPVYIVDPVTGDDFGQVTPPDGGFQDQNSAYLSVLNTMAQPAQDPNDPNYDPTAGLYVSYDNFDPTNPGQQISADDAFADLSTGQAIYFHPPNGDWESLGSLDDLNAYLYTQETNPAAPPPAATPAPADNTPPDSGYPPD